MAITDCTDFVKVLPDGSVSCRLQDARREECINGCAERKASMGVHDKHVFYDKHIQGE